MTSAEPNSMGLGRRLRRSIWHVVWITAVGMMMGELVAGTSMFISAQRSFYLVTQTELDKVQGTPPNQELVLVDLSRLVAPGGPEGGSDANRQLSFSGRQAALEQIFGRMHELGAKGIFFDGTVALPVEYRDLDKSEFSFSKPVVPELRATHLALSQTISRIQGRTPVVVLGDGQEAVRSRGLPIMPSYIADGTFCTGVIPLTDYYPYMPVASKGKGDGRHFPPVSDALIARFGLNDLLYGDLSKWLLFHSIEKIDDRYDAYWIDYSFAPGLLSEAIGPTLDELLEEERWRSKIVGRIVVLGDLSEPLGEDQFPLPLDLALSQEENEPLYGGSGAVAHACSLLTRTERPIFSLREGWPSWILFGALNLALETVSCLLACLAALRTSGERRVRLQVLVGLVFLVASSFLMIAFAPALLARANIWVPQFGSYMLTRVADALSSIIALGLSLWGKHGTV